MTNLEWIAAGNTGCTFATLFARKPEQVGWVVISHEKFGQNNGFPSDALLLSVEFPENWTAKQVYEWTKKMPYFFLTEDTSEDTIGLRAKMNGGKSWVQYFGPDSHVVTRQTPTPMLMYTRKLNPLGYFKQVGFNGILHLAHAFSSHITEKMADILWKRSYEQVHKKLGHKPTTREAAKVTWLKKDII